MPRAFPVCWPDSKPLEIREASVDITPDEPLPLGGYTARHDEDMTEGGEPLFARCVLFSVGNWKEAIVSVEMLTVPDSLYAEVRKRIPVDVGLFLSATHTHSAPDSQLLNDRMTFKVPGVASFRHRWLGWYADKISFAVTQALDAPATSCEALSVGEFTADLNRGRRPGADPEQFGTILAIDVIEAHEGTPAPNPSTSSLRLRSGSLENRATKRELVLSYPAHPVFYGPDNNQTSGDWPGQLSHEFDVANKPWILPVLAGAIGDVSPKAPGNTDAEKIQNFCSALWAAAKGATYRNEWRESDPVKTIEQPIQMDAPTPSPAFLHDYHAPLSIAQKMVKQFTPEHASICALRMGDLAIIGVPGEPTSHLGRRIRAAGLKMGFKSVLVVSHVNGWIGYILDPVDYSHGGYEASLSFNGTKEGEHVVDASAKAMRELRRL